VTAHTDSGKPVARRVVRVIKGMAPSDGAGVKLTRAIRSFRVDRYSKGSAVRSRWPDERDSGGLGGRGQRDCALESVCPAGSATLNLFRPAMVDTVRWWQLSIP